MTPPPTSDAENATFSRKCYRSVTQRERRGHDPALQRRSYKQQFDGLLRTPLAPLACEGGGPEGRGEYTAVR